MKNNATCTIRSKEITIDVRICAALAANRGGEVYLAAIAPDMELTVITLDEAPGILPCFDEDDACLNLPNTSLLSGRHGLQWNRPAFLGGSDHRNGAEGHRHELDIPQFQKALSDSRQLLL